jgi:hypothetical protein
MYVWFELALECDVSVLDLDSNFCCVEYVSQKEVVQSDEEEHEV